MNELEKHLTNALIEAATIAKRELKYNPSKFLQMCEKFGGLNTAKKLINSSIIPDGFSKLYFENRLDLSVEAIILRDEWIELFSDDEVKIAERRLTDAKFEYIKYPSRNEDHDEGGAWSIEELKATIVEYLKMLNLERNGIDYNKSEINQKLRDGYLKGRSRSSVEFRMQNISAVMEQFCLPRIKGYLPAKNVGTNVTTVILSILEEIGFVEKDIYSPTDNPENLDIKVNKLIPSLELGTPQGIKSPKRQVTSTTVFLRAPLVKAWILKNSNGKCEKCEKNGPFEKEDGSIFLEIHHLVPLVDGGADTIENAIALCPNCHRELHYSKVREEEKKALIKKIPRLVSNQ